MGKILSSFILFFAANFFSQQYVPLLQDGNKWYEINIEYNFDMPSPLSRTYIIINGEETKNGLVYKKLFSNLYCYTPDKFLPCSATGNSDEFYKLIRENEAERKVYYYDESTNTDVLLYDFSLSIGDQIPFNFPYYAINSDDPNQSWIIEDIIYNGKVFDKIISKTFVKNIPYPNSNMIYEGVGSNTGLFYIPGKPIFEGGHFLECFENSTFGKSCNSTFLSSNEISNPKNYKLIYSKGTNSFKVMGKSSENFEIQFYDFSGKLLETTTIKSNEVFQFMTNFKTGLYLYKMISKNDLFTGKIMIP